MTKTLIRSAIAQACVSDPMKGSIIPAAGTDARMQANTLAAEIMAHAQMDSKVWLRFAWRIIDGTTDMRAQLEKTLDSMLKDMRKNNAEAGAVLGKDGKPDVSKADTKQAAARVNSANVQVSKLRTIGKAFNAAATVDGLLAHACETMRAPVGSCTREQVGFEVIVEYARQFSEAKAGRKADPFLTKLAKWLDGAGKPAEDNAADLAHWQAVSALVADLQK